ncbi:hypothetical protein DERF_014074 [Dermatophagoides farinae]|uniref:Uncharacterized protein n=1 Tax=Dermatophagoides farinae TaxID=6954 RepID=A0A922L0Y5_DERFA|nr:hypothetical protein DERF_014074 [Dermatophagoides farinae]
MNIFRKFYSNITSRSERLRNERPIADSTRQIYCANAIRFLSPDNSNDCISVTVTTRDNISKYDCKCTRNSITLLVNSCTVPSFGTR